MDPEGGTAFQALLTQGLSVDDADEDAVLDPLAAPEGVEFADEGAIADELDPFDLLLAEPFFDATLLGAALVTEPAALVAPEGGGVLQGPAGTFANTTAARAAAAPAVGAATPPADALHGLAKPEGPPGTAKPADTIGTPGEGTASQDSGELDAVALLDGDPDLLDAEPALATDADGNPPPAGTKPAQPLDDSIDPTVDVEPFEESGTETAEESRSRDPRSNQQPSGHSGLAADPGNRPTEPEGAAPAAGPLLDRTPSHHPAAAAASSPVAATAEAGATAEAAPAVQRPVPLHELGTVLRDELRSGLQLHDEGDRWKIQLSLDPPELGALRITLEMRHGQIQGVVEFQDPRLQQTLERLIPDLERDLGRQADLSFAGSHGSSRDRSGERGGSGDSSARASAPDPRSREPNETDRILDLFA